MDAKDLRTAENWWWWYIWDAVVNAAETCSGRNTRGCGFAAQRVRTRHQMRSDSMWVTDLGYMCSPEQAVVYISRRERQRYTCTHGLISMSFYYTGIYCRTNGFLLHFIRVAIYRTLSIFLKQHCTNELLDYSFYVHAFVQGSIGITIDTVYWYIINHISASVHTYIGERSKRSTESTFNDLSAWLNYIAIDLLSPLSRLI